MKKKIFLFSIILICLLLVKNIAGAYSYEYKNNTQDVANNKAVTTTTLGALPDGTYVIDKESVWKYRYKEKYSGDVKAELPVVWQKIENNHYVNGATLMLSRDVVAWYPWCLYNDWRSWDNSLIRNFLRTTFYNHLSEKFKNAIVEVQIPFIDIKGAKKTVQDNFFLLSVAEWGLLEQAPKRPDLEYEGRVVNYTELPNLYMAKEVRYVDLWKNYKIENNPQLLTTRTIKSLPSYFQIYGVSGEGYLKNHNEYGGYIRPAVNLKSSTAVSGPYEFKYYVDGKKSFYYYVMQ